MFSDRTSERLRWYAIHTHPKQEDRAERNLKAWTIETFAPRHKQRRHNPYASNAGYLIKPLFPRYIFARFITEELLHKVRFTRGVHSVVGFGSDPLPVDDEIIGILKSRSAADGFIRIGDEFESGDQVLIKAGHFKGFAGVFERDTKEEDRVMILLKTIGYQAHIVIEKEFVMKTSP